MTPTNAHERERDARREALLGRASLWRSAGARAERLLRRRALDVDDALGAVDDYRVLARDLGAARELIPDSRMREVLEARYAQSHAVLTRPGMHPLHAAWSLFRDQIPAVVTRLRPYIVWVTLLFVLSTLAGGWLVATNPELIGLFASPDMISTVERGELWTDDILNIVPSSVLSIQILTNNIVVALFAFCAGFLFGLGTFYIIVLNGLSLGAVFAFTAHHGLDGRLFEFVVAHGCVELSCICLAGAAGAAVGEALIRPTEGTRAASFQRAALDAGKLLFAVAVLLLGCGFIEGYISPDPDVPLWARVTIGFGYFFVMIGLLRGWAFGRSRSAEPLPI